MARPTPKPALKVGPFDVAAEQVIGLDGASFASIVVQLRDAESARIGLAGESLESTYLVNKGDSGVDAGIRNVAKSRWIPTGDSAWQFKAGDLTPSACEKELSSKTADYAREIIKTGGNYRLVLGKSLTSKEITNRRNRLIKAAKTLGLTDDPSRFEVITADGLARWLSEFPSLAINTELGGIGAIGQTFGEWATAPSHATAFVATDDRQRLLETVQRDLDGETHVTRVEGVSGLGKTRLVLEALRGHALERLVVYFRAADQLPVGLLAQLQRQHRSVVLVVDECDPSFHRRLAESVGQSGLIRLVTIGEPESLGGPQASLGVDPLTNEDLAKVLSSYAPQLSHEQQRVVVEVAAGNITWARRLAASVLERPVPSAGQLINAKDLLHYVADVLPTGQQVSAAAALALFRRVGFDGEVASELEVISSGLGISVVDLRAAASFLVEHGLITKQGRYRSVSPQPLALYLAARGWEIFQSAIPTTLLPLLSDGLTERLFSRASELGGSEEIEAFASGLLREGLLSDLDSLASGNRIRLVEHVAVLLPDQVIAQLTRLLRDTDDAELAARPGVRQTIVTALQKLSWHSEHFPAAAGALLRLALLSDDPSRSDAPSIWVDLFGAMLPGTAAAPDDRMDYLETTSASPDRRTRLLVVRALKHALDDHEFIISASELQGGKLLERRGSPKTYGEVWEYRNRAIDTLATLSSDGESEVAEAALKALAGSIHGALQVEVIQQHLATVFASFDEKRLKPIRAEIASLAALFKRADTKDGRAEAISELSAALPPTEAPDALWVLAQTSTWDREPGEVSTDIVELLQDLPAEEACVQLFDLLEDGQSLPAAWEIGQAIATLTPGNGSVPARLSALLGHANEGALLGYLNERVRGGAPAVFDDLVDSIDAEDLATLQLTTRGPKTERSRDRIDQLVPRLPVLQASVSLVGWLHDEDESRALSYLDSWNGRIATQEDYNAVVDAMAVYCHGKTDLSLPLHQSLTRLVEMRRNYPALTNQHWHWAQLASVEMRRSPIEILKLVTELLDVSSFRAYAGMDEEELLKLAIELRGTEAWSLIMDWKHADHPIIVFDTMRWLGQAVKPADAMAWVGDDAARGKTLAGATQLGKGAMPPTAAALLTKFPNDDDIGWELAGSFLYGMFAGNESDRLTDQIAITTSWIEEPNQGRAVLKWAKKLRKQLEAQKVTALKREAERDWF